MAADAYQEYLEKIAPTETKQADSVKEETFTILTFRQHNGAKLGPFELATLPENDADHFSYALGILEKNSATIDHRYHGENYAFSYWQYQGLIYRQMLKAKST
jgi:hypothetical protein